MYVLFHAALYLIGYIVLTLAAKDHGPMMVVGYAILVIAAAAHFLVELHNNRKKPSADKSASAPGRESDKR